MIITVTNNPSEIFGSNAVSYEKRKACFFIVCAVQAAMKKTTPAFSSDELKKAINKKHIDKVCEMIDAGILEDMSNEELKDVFRSSMPLRNMDIIDLLAKKSHYFPIEMLDIEISSHNDKDFVSNVLNKHGKKFKFKEHGDRLFEVACKADCKPYLLFLLGKGLGESQYPRLISGSDTLLEVLSEIKVKALHPDTVVTFFVEAAISGQSEKRIQELIDLGFDISAVNSAGKNACDMLRTGIESYNYGKGKQGKTEKQRDLQGLKTLERLYSAYIAE